MPLEAGLSETTARGLSLSRQVPAASSSGGTRWVLSGAQGACDLLNGAPFMLLEGQLICGTLLGT